MRFNGFSSFNSTLFQQCARANSPFIPNSRAGIYLVASRFYIAYDKVNFAVQTNQNRLIMFGATGKDSGRGGYVRIHLRPNEVVRNVSAQTTSGLFSCHQSSRYKGKPLYNRTMEAGEYVLSVDAEKCQVNGIAFDSPVDNFAEYPRQNCTNPM